MTTMAEPARHVTGGVDTHADFHVAVVIDSATGHVAGTTTVDTTTKGYATLLGWMCSHGVVDTVGIEGTGTYGAGLTRFLRAHDVDVVEVDRPDRKARRRHGKSDPVDAEAAARAALAGTATGIPKTRDGAVEAMRALQVVYDSADRDRTRALNQFGSLLLTAPDAVRDALRGLSERDQLTRAARFIDRDGTDPVVREVRFALRTLARRITDLDDQRDALEQRLRGLVADHGRAVAGLRGAGVHTAAALLTTAGDNPDRLRSEAAFAHLCAAAPIPASSGNRQRHRLNRGGDRRANQALWRIVMVRMSCDERTRDYVARRTAEGLSKREIMRCLKRYVAREVFHALTSPPDDLPTGEQLRTMRKTARLSLTAVADVLGTTATRLSRLERDLDFDTDLARRARAFISAQKTT